MGFRDALAVMALTSVPEVNGLNDVHFGYVPRTKHRRPEGTEERDAAILAAAEAKRQRKRARAASPRRSEQPAKPLEE